MLYCSKCNKRYQDENKFCLFCGAPLEEIPKNLDCKTQKHQQSIQQFDKSIAQVSDLSQCESVKKVKNNSSTVIGMFLLNLIPILGFPAAFVWALTKFKTKKFKLAAFTTIFVVLNIAVTVFCYAVTVNLMKNSLTKAAEKQSFLDNIQNSGSNIATGSLESAPDYSGADDIPVTGFDIPVNDEIVPGDNGMIDPGIINSLIPGFSSFDSETFSSGSFDAEEYQSPEGFIMPEYDEEGNMHVDTDGDGVPDIFVDKDGTFYSSEFQQGNTNNTFPEEDKHGNIYTDIDNDGIYDVIYCADGIVLPIKGTKIEEDGSRYLDNNLDGNYEMYYDTEGNLYSDYDENGSYEILIKKDGNIFYDTDGDGVYEQSYEAQYGQG